MSPNVRQVIENDRAMTQALRRMAGANPPADLTTRLRVIASQEREHRLHKPTWRAQVLDWLERTRLIVDNVMRPLAVPVAGGVFSAALLFSAWVVPTYPSLARHGEDVPTKLSTQARVKRLTEIGYAPAGIILDVTLDERGQMVDYEILSAPHGADDLSRVNLENLLVFSEFVPATSFGRPKKAKIRLGVSSSRIDVKG